MKRIPLIGLIFFCACFALPGFAKKKTVAFCHELKMPQDIAGDEIVWKLVEEFHLEIYQKRDKSLVARGGWDEAGVEVSGDELVVTEVPKDSALAVLGQLALVNQESGQVYRLVDVDPEQVEGAVHYNIGKSANEQDGAGMSLFVFVDAKGNALAKMMQVGWIQGLCVK